MDKAEELKWIREQPDAPDPANDQTLATIRKLVRERRKADLLAALKMWDPLDVMQMLTRMRLKYARKLFQWLPANPSIKVVAELRPEFRSILMEESTLEQFRDILLKVNSDGSQVRLGDVASVELGAQNADITALYNGMPASGMAIKLVPTRWRLPRPFARRWPIWSRFSPRG